MNIQSVQRSSKAVETGSQGEIRGAESATDQVGGMGRDVATLVVGVDGKIQPHELNEVLVLGESKLVGQVVRVILVFLNGRNATILVDVAVDLRGNGGQLGNEVHGVLEGVLPVL